jgi:hypothetical protein
MMDPTLGYGELARLFGCGALGAVGGLCVKGSRLGLPGLIRQDREQPEIELGFFAPILAGGFLAAITAGRIELGALPVDAFGCRAQIAAAIGCAVAVLGPAALNTLLWPLLKRFGLKPPPAQGEPADPSG